MIKFLIVGSGSHGNATLIYDDKTLFQIDMGLPLKRVKEALSSIGKTLDDESAVFITHEHVDHVGTLSLLPASIKRYASPNTLKDDTCPCPIGKTIHLGNFAITSFSVSHDAKDPVGYLIVNGSETLFYVTDTGFLPDDDISVMKGCTYYIFESNHDLKMLMQSNRPLILKRRIKSDLGHLSNVDSALYMAEAVTPNTKGIYLAHLSEECNTPELAIKTYERVFSDKGVSLEGVRLECANQHHVVTGGDE